MALTIADYIWNQLHPNGEHIDMNVCDMKVEKPLIASEDGPQMFRISGIYEAVGNRIDFDFFSVDSNGKKISTHATCGVKYEDSAAWVAAWERSTYMVKSRIESLLHGVQNGNNDLIKRGMAYKLFSGLINYGHKYRGMEEVVLDNRELEATSAVQFQTHGSDGKFFFSPYRTDSVAHLSGFIMLGNENADPSKEVYVSHGWENCRFSRPLSVDKKYRSYVKMHQEGAKMVVGDVYVFEGDTVAGVVEGLRVSPPTRIALREGGFTIRWHCGGTTVQRKAVLDLSLGAAPLKILVSFIAAAYIECRTTLTVSSFTASRVNLWTLSCQLLVARVKYRSQLPLQRKHKLPPSLRRSLNLKSHPTPLQYPQLIAMEQQHEQ